MFFHLSKKDLKIYLAILVCFLVILVMWLYTFKLNFKQESKDSWNLSNLFGDIKQAFEDIPPLPKFIVPTTTPTTTAADQLNLLGEKLKELEKNNTSTNP